MTNAILTEAYFEFCATDRQREVLTAFLLTRSTTKAGKRLKLDRRNVALVLSRIRQNAASRGYDPVNGLNTSLPAGHAIKGVSRLVDADGNVKQQWIKSDAKADETLIQDMIGALCDDIIPIKKTAKPKQVMDDLLTVYPIGDAHIGMYAWADEAGEDFDLEIAERDLATAFARLLDCAPASEECLIAQLGDFYHADDSRNETPGHGNKLDVDGRYSKVMWTGLRILRSGIDRALRKHKTVRVRNAAGNHDPHASVALTMALKALYEKEPRVIIEDSPKPIWWMTFGENLIAVTHGDKIKPEKLPGVLSVDARGEWDRDFKYILHGHFHSTKVIEELGCQVEGFRILAPNDAWHHASGYRSGKEMQCIVYDKQSGEVERHRASLKLIRTMQREAA